MKKTSNIKKFSTPLLAIILSIFLTISTSAELYHQMGSSGINYGEFSPRLTSGIDSIPYYITTNSSFSSYKSNAKIGIEFWNSSSDIYLYESSYSSSICDIQYYSDSSATSDGNEVYGYTLVWVGGGAYSSNNTSYALSSAIPNDYWCGESYINIGRIASSNATKVKSTAAHEVGHILGLGHPNSSSAVMYVPNGGNSPTSGEKSAVANLYIYR